jgi:hypothetical protein
MKLLIAIFLILTCMGQNDCQNIQCSENTDRTVTTTADSDTTSAVELQSTIGKTCLENSILKGFECTGKYFSL